MDGGMVLLLLTIILVGVTMGLAISRLLGLR